MGIVQEYFENALFCCVHYLVNRKLHWTERIFWLMAILVSLGGTYYVVSRNWTEYRDQKPMYKIDTNYLDWSALYPSVVICESKNQGITTKQKRAVNNYLDEIHFNKSLLSHDVIMKICQFAFFSATDTASIESLCNNNPCPKGNYSILMEVVRAKCLDIFSYCEYNGQVFTCCHEFLPILTAFGKCYGFNNYGGRLENGRRLQKLNRYIIRKPGMPEGILYFELKVPVVTIYVVAAEEIPHLHNPATVYPKQIRSNYEYYYRVNIEETVTFDEQKSVPIESRSCRFPHENNLKFFDYYSAANCVIECLMLVQKEICGCILHTYPVGPSEHCGFDKLICASKVPVDSNCDCLPDCNATTIHRVGTYDRKKTTFSDIASKLSFTLDVPAPTLRYIRQSLKSSITITVAIGGSIGFFLGISYLSIPQLFYYFLIRPLSDHLAAKKEQKIKNKEAKMNENFKIARMKLRMEKIEREIQKDMLDKYATPRSK